MTYLDGKACHFLAVYPLQTSELNAYKGEVSYVKEQLEGLLGVTGCFPIRLIGGRL